VALSIPTRLEYIGKACTFLRSRALAAGVCDADRADRILLSLHEAITNAMVHGNLGISSKLKEEPGNAFAAAVAARSADPGYSDRRVDLRFDYDGERAEFVISDEGDGFDTSKLKLDEDEPEDDDAQPSMLASGRGILIMKAFTDVVRYDNGGRTLTLTCFRNPDASRRRDRRRPIAQPVRVMPLRSDGSVDFASAFEALSRDVSEGGVSIVHSRDHTARRLLVEFQGSDGPIYIPAEVCRITPLEGGLMQIGARVMSPPPRTRAGDPIPATPPAIAALLVQIGQSPTYDERRAHARLSYTAKVEITPEDGVPVVGYSRDLSRGGMAMVTPAELPRRPIRVRLPGPGGETLDVAAEVVRCQKITNGVYDIGCRFL
jgi:anti-sigma regulatory factor (Ser/Thr protein kinase)